MWLSEILDTVSSKEEAFQMQDKMENMTVRETTDIIDEILEFDCENNALLSIVVIIAQIIMTRIMQNDDETSKEQLWLLLDFVKTHKINTNNHSWDFFTTYTNQDAFEYNPIQVIDGYELSFYSTLTRELFINDKPNAKIISEIFVFYVDKDDYRYKETLNHYNIYKDMRTGKSDTTGPYARNHKWQYEEVTEKNLAYLEKIIPKKPDRNKKAIFITVNINMEHRENNIVDYYTDGETSELRFKEVMVDSVDTAYVNIWGKR